MENFTPVSALIGRALIGAVLTNIANRIGSTPQLADG